MVIMTAKVPKRKVLVIALVVLAAVLVLTLCLHGAKSGANTEIGRASCRERV